jgi:hypothetical protein
MAIRSLSSASISTGTKRSKFWDQTSAETDFFPIVSTVLSGTSSQIDLGTLPTTYKHLQIRITSFASATGNHHVRFNSDTSTSSYIWAEIYAGGGGGSTPGGVATSDGFMKAGYTTAGGAGSSLIPGYAIIDINSYSDTTGFKYLMSHSGADANGDGYVLYRAGIWQSTSPITSIQYFPATGTFNAGTTFSIYGVK